MPAPPARDEPGCRRFDVVEPPGEADRILLYEIYDDRAAFEAHLKTPHFAELRRGKRAAGRGQDRSWNAISSAKDRRPESAGFDKKPTVGGMHG